MGADFIYAICPMVDLTDERKRLIKECIAKIPEDEFEDCYGDPFDEDFREDLFESTLSSCVDNSRETATIKLGNYWAVITGGMSWGDGPTEAYENMIIQYFDTLWNLLVAMSTEDYLKGLDFVTP